MNNFYLDKIFYDTITAVITTRKTTMPQCKGSQTVVLMYLLPYATQLLRL